MTAPSQTPEAAGLEVVDATWIVRQVIPHEFLPPKDKHQALRRFEKAQEAIDHAKQMLTREPLVTAASAQAAIDAEKARADRLVKALSDIENVADSFCDDSADLLAGQIRIRTRAALQRETQK